MREAEQAVTRQSEYGRRLAAELEDRCRVRPGWLGLLRVLLRPCCHPCSLYLNRTADVAVCLHLIPMETRALPCSYSQ